MVIRILFFLGILITPWAQGGEPVRDHHVEARLVAERPGIVPGESVTIGLLLRHDPGWHTYWKTTATGYASSLDWELPEGFSAGDIQWTVPQVYDFAGFIEYVYEDDELLPVRITAPESAQVGEVVTFKALAAWLMCEKTCIPGEVELTLSLPVVAETPDRNPEWSAAFDRAAARQPVRSDAVNLRAWRQGKSTAVLSVDGPESALAGELYFFDEQTFILPEARQPQERVNPGEVRMTFPIDPAGVGDVERFRGVLHTTASWNADAERPALVVDVPFEDGPPADASPAASETATGAGSTPPDGGSAVGLLTTLGAALLGGLILNLMPCVFPVLGIKIMGFVNQAGAARGKIVAHGLVFTAGVLVSFWMLAGLLIFLRSGGEELGWGFQLQNPGFVYALTVLLLLFALNMSGVFEVGNSAVGVGSGLTARSGLTGSFFSGVLATVVATPCAAPFLAPALGVALALPALSSLAVFTAIGLGLALPYLILSAFPSLVRALPKPGAWMESFKQFMAFLLYGTAGYLVWVLVGQLTEEGGYTAGALLWSIFGLVGAALAAWIYGRWSVLHRPTAVRRTAMAAAAAVLVASLAAGYPNQAFDPEALAGSDAPAVQWESWEPGKAEALAADGNLVYVDFTARWCVTCQSNKAVVFSSDEVRRFFHENGVVALKADWTNRNPAIAGELERFGRSAVPFNLIYGPGAGVPLELPELLTPGIVLDGLQKATGES